ncbi:MAG: PAS domain-containing sensor histidine kinase [Maribacter sp.]
MPAPLKPFFELSLDLLCIANFDGYFVDVNPAFLRMIGYTKEELFKKKINEFIYEEDRPSTQKIREGIHKSQSIINFENRYCTKSGGLVWLSWSAVPMVEEKLVYAIAKDITHDKILKNERSNEMAKLRTKSENLATLNLITSHDLRSPVNSMISLFDFIDYKEIKNKETLEVLKYIELAANGVKNSLDNYLEALKRNQSGLKALTRVFLKNSLSNAINSIGSLIQNTNTKIASDFSEFGSVHFDKEYMESIFLNLITNAIKYAKPGVAPVIKISSSFKDGQKVLTVKDNGKGFDMEKVGHKIFGLGERFDDSKDGKGVGLYLIHNQLKSLNGSITVKSELDKGATFYIRFTT